MILILCYELKHYAPDASFARFERPPITPLKFVGFPRALVGCSAL